MQSSAECFVLITVKDWDLMSRDDFIGEAFLSFDKISRDDHQQQSDESGQLLLPLTHLPLGNVTVAMMYVDITLDRPLIDILSVFLKNPII